MKALKIKGGSKLSGEIKVSSAKNSAVGLIPAVILASDKVTINNVPEISDVDALAEILKYLGAKIKRNGEVFEVDPRGITNKPLTEEISVKLRASYYFMGGLLAKYKKVEMYFPGGCSIGKRPINLHIKGFEALGAKVENKGNKYKITADKLKGANIYLDFPSVGATINIIFAAVLAEGKTVIENVAKEPEVVNIVTYLNNLGAKITGAGTNKIKIIGVKKLKGGMLDVIPDRIEAGTYLIAGAMMGDKLKVSNIIPKHLESLTSKLEEMGADIEYGEDFCVINKIETVNPVKIKTWPYPGFPTDLQQPLTALLSLAKGESIVEETIYENRFQHIEYLKKMGVKIKKNSKTKIKIKGVKSLKGKMVVATDLRAGACLVLAALRADGTTIVKEAEHVLRGYESIDKKLANVGAKIEIIDL